MDLLRMNRIAVTLLLGCFAAFLIFLVSALAFMKPDHSGSGTSMYPFAVVAGILVIWRQNILFLDRICSELSGRSPD
jgi:hypothetical protein